MTDQLSSDLASLRIQRDEGPPQRGPWTTILLALVVIGGGAAAAVWGYPRVRGEIFKTEVATTEISMVSPVQASVSVTTTGYVVPQIVSKAGAKITNQGGDDIPTPLTILPESLAAPETDCGGVDRFLAKRAKTLSLEGRVAIAHLSADEKGLQTVIDRSGQQHPAKDLAPLLGAQRRLARGPTKESLPGSHHLLDGRVEPLGRDGPRRRQNIPRKPQPARRQILD